MGVIDKYNFESRGGAGCSNSSYRLNRTTCCGGYCVEDDELHGVYFDPANLDRRIDLWNTNPCPLCDASEWELIEITESTDVPESWRWASL